ncbi:MAG: GNAT family N-acetyltransferase [Planctomycetes bacterium]|nr:GNAT family N-acetyltransferase [Planctomycetota bacterium]
MNEPTTLSTARLLLRPFALADAPRLQQLAGDRRVAATTLRVPHPYEEGMAEAFIADCRQSASTGRSCRFAIVKSDTHELIGAMGLEIEPEHARAELGYWIGVEYWGQGFATEAGLAMVRHGFEALKLNRIMGHCFAGNRASARVLQKLGMQLEGQLKRHVRKWGEFVDVELYAVVR